MALPENAPVFDRACNGDRLADVSTASSCYAPVPLKGRIIAAFCTISAAITVANSIVTVSVIKAGVTTVLGTITLAFTASAAGSTFAMVISGSEITANVNVGDAVQFTTDGGATTTSIGAFTFVVRGT